MFAVILNKKANRLTKNAPQRYNIIKARRRSSNLLKG